MSNPELPRLEAHYGQLTGVELYAINEHIDQAQAMLANALGVLRECFSGLAGDGAGAVSSVQMERATIALQAEDTVGQLLDHTRLRLSKLARLAQLQDRLIAELSAELVARCDDPALLAQFEARVADIVAGLMALAELRQPVQNGEGESGPVQLF